MVAFDELIYNKEASISGGSLGKKQQMHRDFQHQHQLQGHPGPMMSDPMLLPLVPVGGGGGGGMGQNPLNCNNSLPPHSQQRPLNGGGVVRRYSPNTINSSASGPVTHYNMNTMYNETTFTNPSMSSTPVENNRQILLTHGDTQNVVAKLQQQKQLAQVE